MPESTITMEDVKQFEQRLEERNPSLFTKGNDDGWQTRLENAYDAARAANKGNDPTMGQVLDIEGKGPKQVPPTNMPISEEIENIAKVIASFLAPSIDSATGHNLAPLSTPGQRIASSQSFEI